MTTNLLRCVAAILLTLTIIAAGCGTKPNNNANQPNKNPGNNQPGNNQPGNNQPSNQPGNNTNNGNPTSPTDNNNIQVTDITTKLTTDIEMGPLLALGPQEVKDMYGLDPSTFADSVFMPAMMNVMSTEIAVVKLKSDDQYDEVKAAMENRAQAIQKTFETYLPDQYEASKNYQIIRNGHYVLFSITQDQQRVAEIFNSFFKS